MLNKINMFSTHLPVSVNLNNIWLVIIGIMYGEMVCLTSWSQNMIIVKWQVSNSLKLTGSTKWILLICYLCIIKWGFGFVFIYSYDLIYKCYFTHSWLLIVISSIY